MRCPDCRRRAGPDGLCEIHGTGSRRRGVLELVLGDGRRVPVADGMTIGRAIESTLQLDDPTVSRRQARISERGDGGPAVLEDVGSSHGTWLDGRRVHGPAPLRDGSRIRMGDQTLTVERRRDEAEAGRTIVVRHMGDGAPEAGPRLKEGVALKRLEASEGEKRWVLRDPASDRFLRLSAADADLAALLDGRRTVAGLLAESTSRDREGGPARLTRLLAELGERGLLEGVEGAAAPAAQAGLVQRLARPRERTWERAGDAVERLYRAGGWRLLTRPALAALAVLVLVGLVTFPYLVVARYGTPFVVADRVGVGALIFLVGRFAVVAVHETAHGLVMASFGRRVRRAGLKLVLIFPYAFVDTSEAWFEPRRRRIAVSAAGPVSDFSVGALFSLSCLALPAGAPRDICFQLAFAAYLGGCFNLNPFVDRDGYQILVDVLREPRLRPRAREQLARRLRGEGHGDDSPVLLRYGLVGVVWSTVAAGFAIGLVVHRGSHLAQLAPAPVVWAGLAVACAGLLVPPLAMLAPLRARRRREA